MIIDGRQIAEKILGELKKEVDNKKLKLRMTAVLVGDDPEFKKFVELKGKAAEKIGVEFKIFQFDGNISQAVMIYHNTKLSEEFDGILVELPLPTHLNQQEVLNSIPVEKDVDVLSDEAQARFYGSQKEVQPRGFFEVEPQVFPQIFPPAVEALRILFKELNVDPAGKTAVVFGYGLLVGKPIAYWLEKQGAKVSIIRSKTENPAEISRLADIVVSGAGKPDLITGDMIKEGAVVVDFGYGKKDNKMKGDVDFKSVTSKASIITPVPGGMGPILIAAVLSNLVKLKSKN